MYFCDVSDGSRGTEGLRWPEGEIHRYNVILGIIKAHCNIGKSRPSNVNCGNTIAMELQEFKSLVHLRVRMLDSVRVSLLGTELNSQSVLPIKTEDHINSHLFFGILHRV